VPRAERLAGLAAALGLGLLASSCIVPGTTYSGEGTWYSGGDGGNCGYGPTDPWYAAINATDYEGSRTCGAFVDVTGPDGTVRVRVTDQCSECAPGDLDLGPQAFEVIADLPDGRVPITWQVVSPAAIGNLAYVVGDGSNPWWMTFQVRDHRNIVSKLELLVEGVWTSLPRQPYNSFLFESGTGLPGPYTLRATDVYGEQLVTTGITLTPGAVQPTSQQFSVH
jgi:expansin (peptidoglycan-binding protein)